MFLYFTLLLPVLKSVLIVAKNVSETTEKSEKLQKDESSIGLFLEVASGTEFVDKTQLIEYIVSQKKHLMITAPRGFGKTLNLMMLKEFFEVSADQNGTAIKPNQTKNYALFKRLAIGQNAKVFKKYFSKFPVIYMDLKTIDLTGSRKKFEKSLRAFLKDLYKQHPYLWHSRNLDPYNRELLKTEWGTLTGNDTEDLDLGSAQSLSEILHQHFNKRCVILIDDFDSPVVSSLLLAKEFKFKAQGHALSRVAMLLGVMLSVANDDNILCSVSTGTTTLGRVMTPYVDLIQFIDTLDEPAISRFYGFTFDEVGPIENRLFSMKTIGMDPAKTLKAWYGGYKVLEKNTGSVKNNGEVREKPPKSPNLLKDTILKWVSKEMVLYNPKSVLIFARDQDQRLHIGPIRGIEFLKDLFSFDKFGKVIEQSLINETVVTLKRNYLGLTIESLESLKSKGKILDLFGKDALLQYLMENGYFSRARKIEEDEVEIVVPNIEAERELVTVIYNRKYYEQKLNISDAEIKPFVDSVVNLRHNETLSQAFVSAVTNLFKNKMPENERELLGPMYSFLKDAEDSSSNGHERVTLGKFTQFWDSGKDLIVDTKDGGSSYTIYIGLKVYRQSAYIASTELLDKDIPSQAGRRKGPYLLVGLHLSSENVFTTSCISASDYHGPTKSLEKPGKNGT